MSVDSSYCACCRKLFVIDRKIRCIDCGARVCRQNCSRCDLQFIDSWCCLFCYEERKFINGNMHLIQTSNYINWEPESLNDSLTSFVHTGTSKVASGNKSEDDGSSSEIPPRDVHCNKHSDKPKPSTLIQSPRFKSLVMTVDNDSEDNIIDEDVQCSYENNLDAHRCRVPFPELGMDFLDSFRGPLETDDNDISDMKPEYTKHNSFVESWKDNWLFRKKYMMECSDTVSMFVPNSNVGYRAMIGDEDAGETSDLSENCVYSDEEVDMDTFSAEIDSEYHIINLKNSNFKFDEEKGSHNDFNLSMIHSFHSSLNGKSIDTSQMCISPKIVESDNSSVPKELFNSSSEVEENNIKIAKIDQNKFEQNENNKKRNVNIDEKPLEIENSGEIDSGNASNTSCDLKKNIDGELEEKVIPRMNCNGNSTKSPESLPIQVDPSELNLSTPPKPGSIAEREHKKWENAVPMKNNPYSKENIEKRLSEKKYFRDTSKISGSRKEYYENDLENSYCKDGKISKCIEKTRLMNTSHLPLNTNMEDVEKDSNSLTKFNEIHECNNRSDTNVLGNTKETEETLPLNSTKTNQIIKGFNSMNQKVENKLSERVNELEVEKCGEVRNFVEKNQLKSNDSCESRTIVSVEKDLNNDDVKNNVTIINDNIRKETSPIIVATESFLNSRTTEFNTKVSPTKTDCKNNKVCQQNYNENRLFNNGRNISFNKSIDGFTFKNDSDKTDNFDCIKLPSVKEIIKVFDKKHQDEIMSKSRVSNEFRQIQTNKFPRQLHSLTARSLSKEFREELRQIPNKSIVNNIEKQERQV